MFQAQSISVELGGRRLIEDVGFTARSGAVTAIVGPNGSGKTTLLRALSGDYRYQGTVTLNGTDIMNLRPAQAAAMRAVLPQSSVLSFPFTVREVVALGVGAGLSGIAPAKRLRLPDEALARVDLAGFAGRFYSELSGGEQQRVQLARVLCQVWDPVFDGVPRFLLLDEPVSSLDIKHQILIMDVARQFADAGGGVIAILHDLNLAALYADAILALSNGRVAAFGTPRAVLTDKLIETVFECPIRVGAVPPASMPFVLPQSLARVAPTSKVA